MVAKVGRATTMTWGGAAIGGVQEKNVTFNGEPVDISSDDDSGFRKLLEDEVSEIQVNVSVSGVVKDDVLAVDFFAKLAKTLVITRPSGATLQGAFMLASYQEGKPFKDAGTFQAEFHSSGAVTFTP